MAKSKGKTASQIVSESRQELVDQLIQKMKDGVSPVREMWDSVSTYGLPNNPISGARYQGVNLLRLLIASSVGKYEDSRWMTLKISTVVVQDKLDSIFPNVFPLIVLFLIYWLIRKKKVGTGKIVIGIIAVSILLSFVGIF